MKRTLTAFVLVALTLSGCGGGSSKQTVAAATSSPTSAASASGSPAATGIPKDISAECLKAAQALSGASSALSAGSVSGDLSSEFAALAVQLGKLKDAVPDGSVRDAVQTLADGYARFGERMKGVTYKPAAGTAPPAAYLDALKSFSDPKFAAAAGTVSRYFTDGCKK